MRLLKSPHQTAFRNATEDEYPGVGTVLKAGEGPGDFTLVKIADAGHSASMNLRLRTGTKAYIHLVVIRTRAELSQHLMASWLQKKPFY